MWTGRVYESYTYTYATRCADDILDFKQVYQFDSPQNFNFLKNLRKMQTRERILQKKVLC